MNSDKRSTYGLLFNFLIAVVGITGVCLTIFVPDTEGVMADSTGLNAFRYFTVDGNIFCAASAIIAIVCFFIGVRYSNLVFFLKFSSAVTGILIFIMVIAMVPSMGRGLLCEADMILLHIVNPALCLFSFILFDERRKEIRRIEILYTLIPLLIYGVVAITLCLTKVWTGDEIPYPFLDFYNNPVWASVLIIAGIAALAVVLAYVLDRLNSYFDGILDEWH